MTLPIGKKLRNKEVLSFTPLEAALPKARLRLPWGDLPLTGFTFLEILIVVIILGVIAGFSIPRFRETFNNLQLKMAAYELAQFFRYARGEAVRAGRTYKIVMDNRTYRLMAEKEGGEFERISSRWGKTNLINNGIEVIIEKKEIYFYSEGRIDRVEINLKRGEKIYTLTTRERQGYVEILEK